MLDYIKSLTYGDALIISMFTAIPTTALMLLMRDYWRVCKIFKWEEQLHGYTPYKINFVYDYVYGDKAAKYFTSTTKIYFVLKYLRKKFKRNPEQIISFFKILEQNIKPSFTPDELTELILQGEHKNCLQYKIKKQYNYREIKLSSGLPNEWADKLFIHHAHKL